MRCSPLLMAVLASAPQAGAQSLRKERHPELGLPTLYVPRTFEEIPTQPGERWVKLYFKEKIAEQRRRGSLQRKFRPELRVALIPKRRPATGASGPAGEEPVKVTNLHSYAKHEMRGWRVTPIGPGKRDRQFPTFQYGLSPPRPRDKRPASPLTGYAYVWETDAARYCLIGICHQDDYPELEKLWRRLGDKMKVAEPSQSQWAGQKLDRLYRYKGLSHPDYRITVRTALVEGWKAEDTDNYIIVYHTDDQPLLRKVMRDLELLREEYMKLFPPRDDFDAVSTVRICADRDEYIAYGGSPRSAGYWNSETEELVLYDAERHEKGKRTDDSNTFIVLYHEAFHQYIHYSTGELPPHSWFNEGYGDYFSGATIKNGKVRSIGPNPWRTWLIKSVVLENSPAEPVPWKDIIRFSQKQYYTDPSPKYAQGWSMVYFLNTSREVQQRPQWSKILPTYFDTLKGVYAQELGLLGEVPSEEQRAAAGAMAREAALEQAFLDVDLDEIDRTWRAFVTTLEDPRQR